MKIICVEEHFAMPNISQAGKKELDRLCPFFHETLSLPQGEPYVPEEGRMMDIDALRISDMNKGEIDVQILSSNSTQLILGDDAISVCQDANDQLARAVNQHPSRFKAFASLPTINPTASAKELERVVKKYHFVGANIFGRTNGKFLDDPIFEPILQKAEELNVPLYLHPGIPPLEVQNCCYSGFSSKVSTRLASAAWGWHADSAVQIIRMILAKVFDHHPNLKIIIGHWGEMIPFYLDRLDEALPTSISGCNHTFKEYFMRNIYITPSGMFSPLQLEYCVKLLGADRILFAVDYPFVRTTGARDFLENSALTQEEKEKIAHLNAEKIFPYL